MRKILLAGASAFALTLALGGCSWVQDHMPGSQSSAAFPADANANPPAQSAAPHSMANMPSDASGANATTPTAPSTAGSGSSHHAAMVSPRVKAAQQKLKDDGDYKGQVDGKFGPMTAQAVKDYQQKNGLHVTGRLDHATLAKLGVGSTGSSTTSGSGSSGNSSSGTTGSNSGTAGSSNGSGSSGTPSNQNDMGQPAKPSGNSL